MWPTGFQPLNPEVRVWTRKGTLSLIPDLQQHLIPSPLGTSGDQRPACSTVLSKSLGVPLHFLDPCYAMGQPATRHLWLSIFKIRRIKIKNTFLSLTSHFSHTHQAHVVTTLAVQIQSIPISAESFIG